MLIIILIILGVFLILFEWNMSVYRPFLDVPLEKTPLVSLLIPCRNEVTNIRGCAESLLAQNYPNFEVVVFDDESDDGTQDILTELAAKHANFRWIKGSVLASGWTGKNRACHELSKAAKGEWVLFADADTLHAPDMLRRAMGTVLHRKAALLSTFPRQRFHSFGDAVIVPLMFFVLLMYLPMFFVARRIWMFPGAFSAACGQYMLVRKDAYHKVGGHGAIKNRISEASLIATEVKASGERILLMDGSRWVSCHMYRGFRETFQGFSRSVFATMGGSVFALLFFVILQTFIFIFPYGTMLYSIWTSSQSGILLSLIAISIPLWMRYRIHSQAGMSRRVIWWHGLSIALYHWIMLNSFVHYRFRRNTSWKARSYVNPQA